jgi:anti-sigma regulatory factor (Ser/Thr protein kinase)
MTVHALPHLGRRAHYRHEALLFDGLDEFVDRAVPFVAEAAAADEPVMVALIEDHWAPLRAALGGAAERVHHVDMGRLGGNPARIIPAWKDFVARHRRSGRPMRGIGEPIWAGRRRAELEECQLHEALLNVALPPQTPLWLMCPYDVASLGHDVVEEARRSHPTLCDVAATAPSARFGGRHHAVDLWERPLPAPVGAVEELRFRRGDLAALRLAVRRRARVTGMSAARVDDLALAVNELAANSLDHGGGRGALRLWSEPGAFLCEVRDSGRIADPLVGRTTPAKDQLRCRGVWMVHQLCDLVQMRSTPTGTVVRVHSWV